MKILLLAFLSAFCLSANIHAQVLTNNQNFKQTRLKAILTNELNCKNHLINPSADKALTGWKRQGQASVNRQGQLFSIHQEKASIDQSVSIPTAAQYAYLGAYMRNSKSTSKSHGVLVVLLMDALGKPIKQIKIGKPHTGNHWKYQSKKIDLSSYGKAKTIRVVLKKISKNNTKKLGDAIHFDNLILAFDCQSQPPLPKGKIPTKTRFQKENPNKKSIID